MPKLAHGRLCVIHNNVAEASVRLEVVEQRVVAYLTSLISKDDQDFKTYTISVKDLAATLGLSRKDFYKEVKDTTKNLMKKVMSLRPLDARPGELQIAWLSKARYIDGEGIVELRFDPDLKPYLLQLKEHFTKFPLRDVIQFKSQFSMPIYLLLKQYLGIGWREIRIEDLKQKLGLGEKYKQYGHFKDKVLLMAINEINEKSSINVDFTEIREGRKVVAIRFTIKYKPKKSANADIDMFEQAEKAAIGEVKAATEQQAAVKKYPCPQCGKGELVIKTNSINKAPFWGCTRYKQGCTYTQDNHPTSEAAAVAETEKTIIKKPQPDPNCPKCMGEGYIKEFMDDGRSLVTKCNCDIMQ